MDEKKSRAQNKYEEHVASMRKLHVPGPIKSWDELPLVVKEVWENDVVKEVWENEYPEIDTSNKSN